jgi:hypothetical protein
MNPDVAQAIVDLLIMARKLQEISAAGGQEKPIFEAMFRIAQTAHAGMAALQRDK